MSVPAILRKSVFRLKSPLRSAVAPGVLLLAIWCTPLANASVVYTFTGIDFIAPSGPFTTSDFISGSFTVPTALGDNLSNVLITPASFTFADGVDTVTDLTAHACDSYETRALSPTPPSWRRGHLERAGNIVGFGH